MTARSRVSKDYYTTLGVSAGATEDEIRRAYRRLALRWHPDRNGGAAGAGERFKEVSEAYAVLVDARKRAAYDSARRAGDPAPFHQRREDLFRDLFADPKASAIFEELARELQRAGLRVDVRTFQQTLFGGRAVFTAGVVVVTPFTPALAALRLVRAALAGPRAERARPAGRHAPGRRGVPGLLGRMLTAGRRALGLAATPGESDLTRPLRLSTEQAARGGRARVTLPPEDGGADVIVTIPAGVRHGTRLRVRGKGRPAPSGAASDLYLIVDVADA